MKKIPITVYIVETERGHSLGEWSVTHDETDTLICHYELSRAIAMAVQDLFQKKAMKALGQ